MAINYTLNWTDDSLKPPFTLLGGTINTSATSLALTGKASVNWGERIQEDLIRLLEHFASNGTPPPNMTIGQLWYDVSTDTLWLNVPPGTLVSIFPQSPSPTPTPTPTPTPSPTPTPTPTPSPSPTPTPSPTPLLLTGMQYNNLGYNTITGAAPWVVGGGTPSLTIFGNPGVEFWIHQNALSDLPAYGGTGPCGSPRIFTTGGFAGPFTMPGSGFLTLGGTETLTTGYLQLTTAVTYTNGGPDIFDVTQYLDVPC